MWLWLLGEQNNWFLYRLLSVLCGTFVIVIFPFITIRHKPTEALFFIFLYTFSYPLILYASEARGYSIALCAALFAYFFYLQYEAKQKRIDLFLFWCCTILGILAHVTMVYVLMSLMISQLISFTRKNGKLPQRMAHFASTFTIPIIFIAGFYLFFIKDIFIAGGPDQNFFVTIRQMLLFASGFPDYPTFSIIAVVVVIATILIGLSSQVQSHSDQWIFFLSVLFLAPFSILLVKPPEFLHFRYFLVCLPFFYILAAHVLTRLYESSSPGKALTLLVSALFLTGNAANIYDLMNAGRGNYKAAIAYLAENTNNRTITIGSDHDLANGMVLDFYSRFLPQEKKLDYYAISRWPEEGPEWIVLQSQEKKHAPQQTIFDMKNRPYSLKKEFVFEGTSGWHWSLYRNGLKN